MAASRGKIARQVGGDGGFPATAFGVGNQYGSHGLIVKILKFELFDALQDRV